MRKIFDLAKKGINKIAVKATLAKKTLANNRGEGYLDTVIKLLIAVVLGALLLAGLYALFNEVVMPRLETEVTNMFDYNG